MQELNALDDAQFQAIETAISPSRLKRYMGAAERDRWFALQFYIWNANICEAFYMPIHIFEIVVRNSINKALVNKYQGTWYEHLHFLQWLDDDSRDILNRTVAKERQKHGANLTHEHIVSELSLGFWENLTKVSWKNQIWPNGIAQFFPNAPNTATIESINSKIQSIRTFRNRIAHHSAIFDKNPTRKLQIISEVITWSCVTTATWVNSTSGVAPAISQRPTASKIYIKSVEEDVEPIEANAVNISGEKFRILNSPQLEESGEFKSGMVVICEKCSIVAGDKEVDALVATKRA